MGIKTYKDIAAMQNNPVRQGSTGATDPKRIKRSGGGRVKKMEGSQAERRAPRIRAPRIRRGLDILKEEATAEGVGERIGANLPILGGAALGRVAERAGRGWVKRRRAKKAKKAAKATVRDEDSKSGKKKKKRGK